MAKWTACWLIISLLCFTIAGEGFYLVNCQGVMWGPYPQPVYNAAWNPLEILKWFVKMLRTPEYRSPGEPSTPQQVTTPSTVDEISNIYELVAYCNAHPDLINQRIGEAAQKYDYEVPDVTCQVQLITTDGSGTVETTWFFSNGKVRKIEYGLTGSNVKAKIVSDESFAVTEIKLFLKGQFEAAGEKAEEEFGKKYKVTYYNLDPPLWDSVTISSIILVAFGIATHLTKKKLIGIATPTYIAAAFIYTTPYGPPTFMFFAGITSLITAFTKEETEIEKPVTAEKFLEQLK